MTHGFSKDKFYQDYCPVLLENRNAMSRQSEQTVGKQIKQINRTPSTSNILGITEVPKSRE